MFTLFSSTSSIHKGIIRPPYWEYVRQGMQKNLAHTIHYYRNNVTSVESQHFLVRLLESLTVPISLSLERYYLNVANQSSNLAMALRMTSSAYLGKIFDGVFYGNGVSEVLISVNDDYAISQYDLEEYHQNWQNICAIKVLRHPIGDYNLNLPDGTENQLENEIAVISIDIPKLAIQYRAFQLHEIDTMGASGSMRTIGMFIRMFILPNMLMSHLDQAVCNRMIGMVLGKPLNIQKNRHSFYLPDYDKKITDGQIYQINLFERIKHDMHATLQNIPVIIKESMEEAMLLPDVAETRQVTWALTLARLDTLRFLFKVVGDDAGQRDQGQVNTIRQLLRQYRLDNVFKTVLPSDLYWNTIQPKLAELYDITS